MRVFADLAAWTQVSEGADFGPIPDRALRQHAALANQHIVANRAILDHRVGADQAFGADAGQAQQLHKRLDDRVGRNFDLGVDHACFRAEDGDARGH